MKNKPAPSPFIQTALNLDDGIRDMEELAGAICRLELTSESALEKSKQLLARFTQQSQNLAEHLIQLGQKLQERRADAELAIHKVNEQAPIIQQTFLRVEEKVDRFQALGVRVRELTQSAGQLGVAETVAGLQILADEAASIQEEARGANLRSLERNAKELRQDLRELMRKLGSAQG